MVTCQICGFQGKRITSHVSRIHGIPVAEYKAKYGPVMSPEESKAQSERMAARNRTDEARAKSRLSAKAVNDRYATDPEFQAKVDQAKRDGWTKEARENFRKISSKLRKKEWLEGKHKPPPPPEARPAWATPLELCEYLERKSVGLWTPGDAPFPYEGDLGRPSDCNQEAFDTITPESAYWIGFLSADGGITSTDGVPRIYLSLQSRDRPHLLRFSEFLNTASVRDYEAKLNGKVFPASSTSVRSHRLFYRLAEHGVEPRKSHTIKTSEAMAVNPHFWRGVLDGDGSLRVDPRTKTGPAVGIELAVSSTALLNQWLEFCSILYPVLKGKTKKKQYARHQHRPDFYRVRIGGLAAWQVLSVLYCKGPWLERKYKTAKKAIKEDGYGYTILEQEMRGGSVDWREWK